MTDRPNSPIRIPIRFVEADDDMSLHGVAEDDVIEIDGDDLDVAGAAHDFGATADSVSDDAADVPAAAAEPTGLEASTAAPAAAEDSPAAAKAQPGAELSVEAFTELGRELRQKAEAVERLTAEKNDLYDKLLRKQAEFENFRRRSEREMHDTYRRARADILLDLLPALDNFHLAMEHADTADATVLREGFGLIYKQLTDTLGRHGLEAVEAEGRPFDPELHEAVATEVKDDLDDNTVLQEFQRGYKIGERLLRPARVKVSTQG
jgi:molecular chaperone GrpE